MIYIIRHAKTDMNSRKALQGRSDRPLNGEGREQAAAAAEALAGVTFSKVFSSPLRRALETARIVVPYADPVTDERLTEMDYGPYEGADLTDPPPEIVTFFSDFIHNPAPDGMEQLSSVVARTGAFLEEIGDCGGDILISTHAIALKGMLEYLTPGSGGSWWSRYVGNCAVFVTGKSGGAFAVPEQIVY